MKEEKRNPKQRKGLEIKGKERKGKKIKQRESGDKKITGTAI